MFNRRAATFREANVHPAEILYAVIFSTVLHA